MLHKIVDAIIGTSIIFGLMVMAFITATITYAP